MSFPCTGESRSKNNYFLIKKIVNAEGYVTSWIPAFAGMTMPKVS